jgi:RNA polymerase sigma-70 factor, ECF subfamily
MIAPAGSELDDVELMAKVVRGDVRAFEQLYDRFASKAFSLAMRVVGDRGTAADVTQEAFLELWRNRERYRAERGLPGTWLLGIVRNRAIDAHRLRTRRGGHPQEDRWDSEQVATDDTESEVISNDEARSLREALDQLPQEQLAVMNLAYFGGLTQNEIAKRLELPLGTVKGRIRLALTHLKGSVAQPA